MIAAARKRDGFIGEKLINVPQRMIAEEGSAGCALTGLHITQIGYFPHARDHYRERRKGCPDNILIYCVNGKGHYILDKKRFEVSKDQFVILPATDKYMRYWADSNEPWTIYWVHFSGDLVSQFNDRFNFNIDRGPLMIPLNQAGLTVWNEIFDSLAKGFKKEHMLNANFCLYHLLATFLFPSLHTKKAATTGNDMVQKAIGIMEKNLSSKLTVEELAAKVGLSSSYFSTAFRRSRGLPPIDYFINMKMHKACELIRGGKSKIKMVCRQLGYDDPYYFSRLFKRFVGMSPARYKKAVLSGEGQNDQPTTPGKHHSNFQYAEHSERSRPIQ